MKKNININIINKLTALFLFNEFYSVIASAGRADDRRCCHAARGGVPCRSRRRGT
jgi:hypothetical protein